MLMPHSPFLYKYKEKDYKNIYNISEKKSQKSDFLSVGYHNARAGLVQL